MTLADTLDLGLDFRVALAIGMGVSLAAALVVTPRAMRKLQGAGIVGHDIHKPGRPEVPEMGGLAVFLAFNVGAFTALALSPLTGGQQALVLASLVVAAGACITGVLDDLVVLRQRFKAFIPFAFAAPLALFLPETLVALPFLGAVDFGLAYPLLLVPLGIACASNGFNMLEGFNGLGPGLGIILGTAIAVLAILSGNLAGLALLFPLIGALGGFLIFNVYPARVFPGDTLTLFAGAVLGAAAILSKVEVWGALLFVPHVVEFFLKLKGGFRVQSFASAIHGGRLHHEGPVRSLTHVVMRVGAVNEPTLVLRIWGLEVLYCAAVVGLFVLVGSA